MGLVQTDSLLVVEDATDRLLMDFNFSPPRSWTSSWAALKKAFSDIDFKAARSRLGGRLFNEASAAMMRAANATLARPTARSWGQIARRHLDKEQARLAEATTPVVRFEAAL